MFLDLKLGLLWAVVVGIAFHEPITVSWILASILFAFLPDIDFWVELARRGTVGGKTLGDHRTLLHAPLLYLPAAVGMWWWLGPAWATLFSIGVFGHHIHDTMGMGFGVRWLFPFSKNFYKIFSDKEGNIFYDREHLRITSWNPEELRVVLQEKGNDHWLQEDLAYARKHAFSTAARLFFSALLFLIVLVLLHMRSK
ncbi:MAG: metal-dependent hydrolase [Candidatus Moraniibacteriota bacterium]|nr:MAG: metal-dependent hydrolase [Candidatus Moranbacteria bacterium]